MDDATVRRALIGKKITITYTENISCATMHATADFHLGGHTVEDEFTGVVTSIEDAEGESDGEGSRPCGRDQS